MLLYRCLLFTDLKFINIYITQVVTGPLVPCNVDQETGGRPLLKLLKMQSGDSERSVYLFLSLSLQTGQNATAAVAAGHLPGSLPPYGSLRQGGDEGGRGGGGGGVGEV